jgi:hypothetical protein
MKKRRKQSKLHLKTEVIKDIQKTISVTVANGSASYHRVPEFATDIDGDYIITYSYKVERICNNGKGSLREQMRVRQLMDGIK